MAHDRRMIDSSRQRHEFILSDVSLSSFFVGSVPPSDSYHVKEWLVIYIQTERMPLITLHQGLSEQWHSFSLVGFVSISVSLKTAYCLPLPCLGSEGDFDDVCVTVQCCKLRYNRQSLRSVRGFFLAPFSVSLSFSFFILCFLCLFARMYDYISQGTNSPNHEG